MNIEKAEERVAPTPSRRRLMRGAAWAVPTVIVTSAAPAFAASPVACPPTPTPGAWTTSHSGTLGPTTTGGYGWSPSEPYNFNEYQDNGSSSATLVITTTTTINVISGTTYTLNTPMTWGYGNGNASQSTTQTVALSIDTTQVFSVTSRSSQLGAAGTTTNVPGTYTANSTGPVTMRLTFTLAPKTQQANDDFTVFAPKFTRCMR